MKFHPINTQSVRFVLRSFPALAAILLTLLSAFIAPYHDVQAQGISGTIEYTVLSGQVLTMYAAPDTSSQIYGNAPEGAYKGKGLQQANNWYQLNNTDGTIWYFQANPTVVTVKFTEDATPTATPDGDQNPSGNNSGGDDTNITVAGSIQGGNISKLPGIVKTIVIPLLALIGILGIVLYFIESIRDERYELLTAALIGIVVIGILTGILAYVNSTSGETCLENVVCFGKSKWAWLLSGGVVIAYGALYVILYMLGSSDVKPVALSNEEETKVFDKEAHLYEEFYEEARKDDMLPTAPKPVKMVGKDAGKLYMTFVKMEEFIHREGGPTVVITIFILLGTLITGLMGQAYLGPLHFKVLSEPSAGFSLAAIPLFLLAFLVWFQSFVEAIIENHGKKAWRWAFWIVGWILAVLLPFVPPLFTLGGFHMLAIGASGGMKEFFRGHSDMIGLTICTIILLFVLGYAWPLGIGGPIWQNDYLVTSWNSWAGQAILGTR